MTTCPVCRLSAPREAAVCPSCKASLLAPSFVPAGPDGPSPFAPAIFQGRRLTPADDLAAILMAAGAEDELELGPGDFVLAAGVTLKVPLSLSGAGKGRTRILCAAPDFVLRVLAPGRVSLAGLALVHEGQKPADVLWGLMGLLELHDCLLSGAVSRQGALAPPDPEFSGPSGRQGGRGAWLAGDVQATLRRCELVNNGADGLEAAGEALVTVDACVVRGNRGNGAAAFNHARLVVAASQLAVNYQSGVAFHGAAKGRVLGSTCAQNGASGIALHDAAGPELSANTLRANGRSGLAYWHSAHGEARENVIEANQGPGIEVQDEATPSLIANQLGGNAGSGLLYAGQARGMALRNVSTANQGLGLDLGPQAEPTLAGNTLAGNALGSSNTVKAY